jgi:PmbA protein
MLTEWIERNATRDLGLAESLVERALLAGAVAAEAYFKSSATSGIVLGQDPATLSGATERGAAIRVFDGEGRFGFSCSSRTERAWEEELIRRALASLRESARTGPAEGIAAASPGGPPADPAGIADPRVATWTVEEKRALVASALALAAWARSPGTLASYRDGVARITLANSLGFAATYRKTLAMLALERPGGSDPSLRAEWVGSGPDRDAILELSGELAQIQPVGGDEVVDPGDFLVDGPAATTLLRRLARELVEPARGGTPAEEDGTVRRVASEAVSVTDDGRLEGGIASAPFDAEGFATGRIPLVRGGVRVDRLRRPRPGEAGRPGCAVRVSYRDLPVPSGTNLVLQPGRRSRADLAEGIERGFRLAVLESAERGSDSTAGSGWWRGIGWELRDGNPVGPCRRILFRAETRAILENVLEVSDRVRFVLRHGVAFGSPDLLIRRR